MESQPAGSDALLVERLLHGGWTAQVLRTAAVLRLSDHLASGLKSLDELALATGTEPAALARFLRVCVLLGLCTDQGGHFELAPTGEALRADVPNSLRPAALLLTAPWVQHAWETLPEAVRTGRQTFSTAHASTSGAI
jgi:Dimerisation domain